MTTAPQVWTFSHNFAGKQEVKGSPGRPAEAATKAILEIDWNRCSKICRNVVRLRRNAAVDAEDEETNDNILEEMMEDLEKYWPVAENAAVDAEKEEIHVVAALERADSEAAEASAAHRGPAAAYVAGDLAAADRAATAAGFAGDPAGVVATEDAPQVYGALKCYSSHKRWWFTTGKPTNAR